MGCTETYVYVCLRTPPETNRRWYILKRRKTLGRIPRWFTLPRGQILKNAYDLIPIPCLPSQAPEESSVVVLDGEIYVIGGLVNGKRTSDVFVLDCRTHTWRQLPSMGLPRASAATGVVDGKMYVFGGCSDSSYCYYGEVFDPKTQTWNWLPPMPIRKSGVDNIQCSFVRDQKVYAVDGYHRTFYYSPIEGKWRMGNRGQTQGNSRDWCMIGDMIYYLDFRGSIFWCEPHELDGGEQPDKVTMDEKEVKGLRYFKWFLRHSRLVHFDNFLHHKWEQTKLAYANTPEVIGENHELELWVPGARLTNCGDNILIFWDLITEGRLEIWCGEISLDRRQGGEIWGNMVGFNPVLTVDPFTDRYKVLYSVSVTF